MMAVDLPSSFLKECFVFDELQGNLIWIHRPESHFEKKSAFVAWNAKYPGKIAGCKRIKKASRWYVQASIRFDGRIRKLMVHRVAFALMGVPLSPTVEVDHKDCDPWNNKWVNLRLGSHSQNQCNIGIKIARRKSGQLLPKGVCSYPNGYRAGICINGKKTHLGCFSSIEEASNAYQRFASKHMGEFFRAA